MFFYIDLRNVILDFLKYIPFAIWILGMFVYMYMCVYICIYRYVRVRARVCVLFHACILLMFGQYVSLLVSNLLNDSKSYKKQVENSNIF